jgi:Transposase DDE domain group 1
MPVSWNVVAGELLTRAWAAGAGPGEEPFTIDVDSSIHETYGLAKEGGTHFTYNHVRGYNPLYAVAAGTGDVVHTRLRGGNAHSGRGAASFLTETFGRVRAAGATGPLVLRAVVRSLLSAYQDSDLFSKAISEAQERAALDESPHDGERAALLAELDKVERGIDRYLRAFEAGTMPEEICGKRVKDLGTKATALQARMFELDAEIAAAERVAPTSAELSELRQRVEAAVAGGSNALVKSLLQALIHEVRVDSREAIHPVFRVPVGGDHQQDDAVRAPSRSVEAKGLEPSNLLTARLVPTVLTSAQGPATGQASNAQPS